MIENRISPLPAQLSKKLAFLTGHLLIGPAITFGAALENYDGSADFGAHDFRNPADKGFGPKGEFDLLRQALGNLPEIQKPSIFTRVSEKLTASLVVRSTGLILLLNHFNRMHVSSVVNRRHDENHTQDEEDEQGPQNENHITNRVSQSLT